jgi:uncharacterized protein YbcI
MADRFPGEDEKGTSMDVASEHTDRGSLAAAISNAVVRVMHEYTGRGPTKARTTINRDSVMVLMSDTLTKAERHLADKGKADLVIEVRREFQESMREDLVGVITQLTGRPVAAFMSTNHIDPDMACEIFVLVPNTNNSDGHH